MDGSNFVNSKVLFSHFYGASFFLRMLHKIHHTSHCSRWTSRKISTHQRTYIHVHRYIFWCEKSPTFTWDMSQNQNVSISRFFISEFIFRKYPLWFLWHSLRESRFHCECRTTWADDANAMGRNFFLRYSPVSVWPNIIRVAFVTELS